MPTIISIPLSELDIPPWNPRKFWDEDKMQDLTAYLEKGGVVPRIWVWKGDGKPPRLVIAGQRRIEAYRRLGRTEIEAEILDIPLEEAKILAITSNQDEEMHWWDWVKAIGQVAKDRGWKQRELAARLGCSQTVVNRAAQIRESLNPEARALLDSVGIKKNPLKGPAFSLAERVIFALTDLFDPEDKERSRTTVAKAMKVANDREMTEVKAKLYVAWIKDGNDPALYGKDEKAAKKKRKVSLRDPNREVWKDLPEEVSVTLRKDGFYDFHAHKVGKFAAPGAIFGFMDKVRDHEQRVTQVENPQAVPPNPFKDRVEELFEKGVRDAIEACQQKQNEWLAKQAKKPSTLEVKAPLSPDVSPDLSSIASAKGEALTQGEDLTKGEADAPGETACGERPEGVESVSEEELKRLENGVKEVLGEVVKDPKEVMKKLLGDIFRQP